MNGDQREMRSEYKGISLWYGTPDAPAPEATVMAGSVVTIRVGVAPAHEDNTIEVRYRVDKGPEQKAHIRVIREDSAGNGEYFEARIDPRWRGENVTYYATCRRGDIKVPPNDEAVRNFSSSFEVIDTRDKWLRRRHVIVRGSEKVESRSSEREKRQAAGVDSRADESRYSTTVKRILEEGDPKLSFKAVESHMKSRRETLRAMRTHEEKHPEDLYASRPARAIPVPKARQLRPGIPGFEKNLAKDKKLWWTGDTRPVRCDPRVVSLKGVQITDSTVEAGNHLRAFVGTEHGFFKDALVVYRRPHTDKLPRTRFFEVPVIKGKGRASWLTKTGGQSVPMTLTTNDPLLKLSGHHRIGESGQSTTLEISFPKLIGYLEIQVSSSSPELKESMEVIALYQGELVATERDDAQGLISLTNVPLDEIRITAPLDFGFRVEFLLMEEDAKLGEWMKVEELPGPQRLLASVDAENASQVFTELLKNRFWPDVQNRFLKRGQAAEPIGWPRIDEFYGGEQFEELIELLQEVYNEPGWIQQLILGAKAYRGYRGYQSVFTSRNYDPEQLALLITLTLDVNIATLLGLHTVDRGQHPSLPERTLDDSILKKYRAADWKQTYDYMVQGKWPHLRDTHANIYYDLSESTTPRIAGKAITDSRMLDSVEIGYDEAAVPVRRYKVGLSWDISEDIRSPLTIAYDIYRNGQLVTVERPMTPARTEDMPQMMSVMGRSIPFHRSLPKIPPFSKPTEICPAESQYVDTQARFGTAVYAVESVDLYGRFSADGITHTRQVEAPVPIPVPTDLRTEIRRAEGDGLEVVSRWDWFAGHRAMAPDWVRFEVFFHDGVHRASLNGAIAWIEKHPTDSTAGKFAIEAFVDSENAPVPLSDLSSVPDYLLLQCDGRTYRVRGITTSVGPQPGVDLIDSMLEAKNRRGVKTPPALTDGTRGVLLKRSSDGVIRAPFFVEGTVESEALTGANVAPPVRTLISKANTSQFFSGDTVRVLLDDFLLAGKIANVDTVAHSRDGVAVGGVEIEFESGWAEYHVPVPTRLCTWLKADDAEWIDRDDTTNWPVGPIALPRPAEYPLQSTGGLQIDFPLNISPTPDPQLNWVVDQDGQISGSLSSIVLPTDGFAAASGSLLTGCQIRIGSFNEYVRQNLKGETPQLVATIPENLSQAQANALLSGQQVLIRQTGASYAVSANTTALDVGETRLEVTFADPPPLQEWRLCSLHSFGNALLTDSPVPEYSQGPYYFRILNWRVLPGDGKTYEFVIANLMLSGDVEVEGVHERVEFELAPGAGPSNVDVPALYSATFDLSGLSSAAFYRQVDGGEIHTHSVARDSREPDYDPENPSETVAVLTTAAAVSHAVQSGTEQLHVAFFPALNPFVGFQAPPVSGQVEFYPSFRLAHSPAFLNEENLRNNVAIHATVRAVIQEGANEFLGPLAPVARVPMARGRLELSPPPPPPPQPALPLKPVYARPGPRSSTHMLYWDWDAYEFKVYRVPANFVDDVRLGGETDRDVLNDYSRMESALSLRNKSQLRETSFTDVFESRGGGRYYYKVIGLDKTGLPSDIETMASIFSAGLIFPDPERQGPLLVLDTVVPDTPALQVPKVVNNKVVLDWQSDPCVDEYWIYRSAEGYEPDAPLKLKVADIDDATLHPSLERVPIVAGTESEPIRCIGLAPPVLDLFWMPDMYQVIGIYPANEYDEWVAGDRNSVTNIYPGNTGEVVKLKHWDGSEENINLDASLVWSNAEHTRPGPQLAVEYLTEHEVRLPGDLEVLSQEIVIRTSPDIAVLVGIYKIENFDPHNPQNPLSGTLDLTGAYPVIRDVRDGTAIVEDGLRPVIIYKRADDPAEPNLTIYGAYPVQSGAIELISGAELPSIGGESAAGPVSMPAEYTQPDKAIVSVYQKSDYEADAAAAQNLYNHSYNGTKITGIDLPDNEPVVVFARQLSIGWANRVNYHSLRIEGYPQVTRIDEVRIAEPDAGGFRDPPVPSASVTFDPSNPDSLTLPADSIFTPGTEVLVRYTDDTGMQRTLRAVADDNMVAVARTTQLPGGLAPYIKDFLGVWRQQGYDPANPDANMELVVRHGNQMSIRNGSLIQVHADAGLPVQENDESVNLAVRFKDHKDGIRSVTYKPGWLRFRDENPQLNGSINYHVKAVKVRDYQEDGNPKRLEIGSRLSQAGEITLIDPAPPVPPEILLVGIDGTVPELQWDVVDNIAEYQVQRRTEDGPAWQPAGDKMAPAPQETEMFYRDTDAELGQMYFYRLSVKGRNGKPNVVFQESSTFADLR